jgi:hypothetical protein
MRFDTASAELGHSKAGRVCIGIGVVFQIGMIDGVEVGIDGGLDWNMQ